MSLGFLAAGAAAFLAAVAVKLWLPAKHRAATPAVGQIREQAA